MCQYSWDYTINHNENENKNKNKSHRYDINRPRSRHGEYKMCLSMIMLVCIKQHLNKYSWKS